jgi:hypothetical protein
MPGHELLQGAAIDLTSRGLELSREAFGLFKYAVGNRDSSLHTLSITEIRRLGTAAGAHSAAVVANTDSSATERSVLSTQREG